MDKAELQARLKTIREQLESGEELTPDDLTKLEEEIAAIRDALGMDGEPEEQPAEEPAAEPEAAPEGGDEEQREEGDPEEEAPEEAPEDAGEDDREQEPDTQAARRAAARRAAMGLGKVLRTFDKQEGKHMDLKELRSSMAYNDAFRNYLVNRDDAQLRKLLTEVGTAGTNDGTVPLPVVVQEAIETAWDRDAQLSSLAKAINVKGLFVVPYEQSATPAVIHAEGAAAPDEEKLVMGKVTITPATIKKWISVTDELLAMKSDAFLQYIFAELTHQILLKLDADIVANLVATTNANGIVSEQVTSSPSADTIFNGLAALADDARNPVIVMNKAVYFNTFMTLKDSQLRPIYDIVSENGAPSYYINGVRVVFCSAMPATATGTYAVVGDFDGYTINFVDGKDVDVLVDPYTNATADVVRYIGKLYCGHGITRPKYFAAIKKAS